MKHTASLEMNDVHRAIAAEAVRQERSRLTRFIRSRVRDEEDARDIAQEVFYQFSATLPEIGGIEKAASWLFTVARRKIADLYRKKKPAAFSTLRQSDPEQADEDSSPMLEPLLADLTALPDHQHIREELWDALAAALDELPREQREAFILNELEEKSFREISDETGVPVNTLLSRKRYAVLHLRFRLRNFYEELAGID